MTTEAAQAYIEAIPPARRRLLEELATAVDKITAGTRELLVRRAWRSAATIDAWNAAYQHYVPLFKDEADQGDAAAPARAGLQRARPASKRATGSTGRSPTCWRTC
jgi:hypothetical protein